MKRNETTAGRRLSVKKERGKFKAVLDGVLLAANCLGKILWLVRKAAELYEYLKTLL